MKRFHVHIAVHDLSESVRFYSALFAAKPSVLQPEYATQKTASLARSGNHI